MEAAPLDLYSEDPILSETDSESDTENQIDMENTATMSETISVCLCNSCPAYLREERAKKGGKASTVCCNSFTKLQDRLKEKGE